MFFFAYLLNHINDEQIFYAGTLCKTCIYTIRFSGGKTNPKRSGGCLQLGTEPGNINVNTGTKTVRAPRGVAISCDVCVATPTHARTNATE